MLTLFISHYAINVYPKEVGTCYEYNLLPLPCIQSRFNHHLYINLVYPKKEETDYNEQLYAVVGTKAAYFAALVPLRTAFKRERVAYVICFFFLVHNLE